MGRERRNLAVRPLDESLVRYEQASREVAAMVAARGHVTFKLRSRFASAWRRLCFDALMDERADAELPAQAAELRRLLRPSESRRGDEVLSRLPPNTSP